MLTLFIAVLDEVCGLLELLNAVALATDAFNAFSVGCPKNF